MKPAIRITAPGFGPGVSALKHIPCSRLSTQEARKYYLTFSANIFPAFLAATTTAAYRKYMKHSMFTHYWASGFAISPLGCQPPVEGAGSSVFVNTNLL